MLKDFSIRPLLESDLPTLLSWRNHPEVRRFMFSQHEIGVNEHREWFALASMDEQCQLLIVECTHIPVGYVKFEGVNEGGISDWGFYVDPGAPKGSGTGVGVVALNYAFNKLQLRKVYGEVIEGNQRSILFHRKLGFIQEGFLRDHRFIDGVYHSLFCFGLFAKDWRPLDFNFSKEKNGQN